MSPTFTTTVLKPNDELKTQLIFPYNYGPSRSQSKLNHLNIGERQYMNQVGIRHFQLVEEGSKGTKDRRFIV